MKYEDVLPISREAAEAAFRSDDVRSICDALVRVSYHDPDWKYAQAACLALLCHPAAEIRGLACTCLGHVARIHRELDRALVEPALNRMSGDAEVAGRAADALEDIEMFMSSGDRAPAGGGRKHG